MILTRGQFVELDNQQERPVGLEYVAGLITGEGCFYLAVQRIKGRGADPRANRSRGFRITPGFRLFMQDKETIEVIAATCKNHGLPVYIYERINKNGTGRSEYGIHATGLKRAHRYTQAFIPLLTGQKKRAAVVLQRFIESRLAGSLKDGYTDEQVALVEELRSVNGNPKLPRTSLESSETTR